MYRILLNNPQQTQSRVFNKQNCVLVISPFSNQDNSSRFASPFHYFQHNSGHFSKIINPTNGGLQTPEPLFPRLFSRFETDEFTPAFVATLFVIIRGCLLIIRSGCQRTFIVEICNQETVKLCKHFRVAAKQCSEFFRILRLRSPASGTAYSLMQIKFCPDSMVLLLLESSFISKRFSGGNGSSQVVSTRQDLD